MQHHFWWTAADSVGKPSSCRKWDLVTRWSWNQGCHHFFLLYSAWIRILFLFSQLSTFEWILMYTLTVRLCVSGRLCFGGSISGIMSSVDCPEIITDQFAKAVILVSFWCSNKFRLKIVIIILQISKYARFYSQIRHYQLQGAGIWNKTRPRELMQNQHARELISAWNM